MNKDERARRHAAALLNVSRALDAIQRAQNNLDEASQALSSICHGAAKCRKAGKVRDQVHALWYAIDGMRHDAKIYLDRDPGP